MVWPSQSLRAAFGLEYSSSILAIMVRCTLCFIDEAIAYYVVFSSGGWFSRDPEVFRRVGSVILPKASRKNPKIKRWLVCSDAFALADQAVQNAIFKVINSAILKPISTQYPFLN